MYFTNVDFNELPKLYCEMLNKCTSQMLYPNVAPNVLQNEDKTMLKCPENVPQNITKLPPQNTNVVQNVPKMFS